MSTLTIALTLELIQQRIEQGATGTNSDLSGPAGFICRTIELPWRDNQKGISCVPAGRYALKIEQSPTHGKCLELLGVPGRGDCQYHKANWALGKDGKHPELKGCIAPVMRFGGLGIGWESGVALAKLEALAFPVLEAGGQVWVTILDVVTAPVVASKQNSRVGNARPAKTVTT